MKDKPEVVELVYVEFIGRPCVLGRFGLTATGTVIGVTPDEAAAAADKPRKFKQSTFEAFKKQAEAKAKAVAAAKAAQAAAKAPPVQAAPTKPANV